jgi:vitamin B12 transporter
MLTVGECERIEVLKGAQSTLYGSDAVAGVINIFTKKGNSAKPVGGTVSFNVGSYGTFRGSAGINGSFSKGYYNLQYTRLTSKGFSSAYDKESNGFDNDGTAQNNLLANIGLHLTKNLTLKFRSLLNGYQSDIDAGAFADEKDFTIDQQFRMVATGLEYQYEKGKLTFNYSFSQSKRTYIDDSTSVEKGAFNKYAKQYYGGNTQFIELYNSLKINDQFELLTGADYRFNNTDQTYESYSNFGKYTSPPLGADTAKTNILSVYTSVFLKTKVGFFMELGGRYNRHSLYGSNFTYSFNPSYLIHDQLKVFFNFSSGFKAPSLYHLYSPYGNKTLKPEKSLSTELGLQVFSKNRASNLRLLYFDRRINDVIFFQSLSQAPYGSYINFDKQYDQGWELEGKSQTGKLSIWGNLTLLNGAITTNISGKDTTYNNLYRRPKALANVGAGYQITKKLFVSTSLRSVGKRLDRFYNTATFNTETVTLDAYSTLDVYSEYQFSKLIKAYIDLKNLTDKQYFDTYGYNTRRFNFMAGLQLNF